MRCRVLHRSVRVALVLSSWFGQAAAQTPDIVPPRLSYDPGVSYPRRALEENFREPAAVVLILELDDAGEVVRATVEEPQGHGFDEAALQAAEQLRFEPAQRAGKPAAARIRYRYSFEPPLPAPVEPVVAAPTADSIGADTASTTERRNEAPPRSAGALPPIDVTVRGERLEPTVSSYTRTEVRRIPGAFGDPFRAVETLPGVTPIASGLPFFYVRGAPPGNVGYFLDGVRVPYLYHIGAGPSVVQPAIVERVDLHPGGYPARFGRFAGGLVSASTTEPATGLHGEGNLRLFDVGGLVESGFADGRGSVLLGGRYSYTGALLSLAAPEYLLDYRDFQARISYDLTPKDRVSVFSFGSYDLLGHEQNGILDILFGSEFYRADLRYDRRFDGGSVRSAITLGYDQTNAEFLAGDQRNAADRSIGARTELRSALGASVLLRTGADVTVDAYELEGARYDDPDSPETRRFEQLFPPRTDHAAGAWLDLVLDLSSRIQLTPGLRADLYGSGAATAIGVDPRVSVRFDLTRSVRVTSAFGLAHQAPSFVIPVPGISPALGDGLQRSVQSSAGVEIALADATTTGTTLFYNAFFAMTDAVGTSDGEGAPDFGERSRGASFGAEVFLRRRLTERFGGFVSYTLSRSQRRIGSEQFLSAFDRPHVVSAAVSYDLGRGWRTGGRFSFYSGTPVQPSSGDTIAARTTDMEREPPFYRLDLRLEKRWAVGDTGWISFVAEFMNATLNKETWPGGEEIGPIAIPSLGLEGGFE